MQLINSKTKQKYISQKSAFSTKNSTEAIIHSMTPKERENPALINGSRKQRIAAGSGTTVQEVNRLLKQFDDTRKMMKTVAGGMPQMAKMAGRMKR